LNAVLKATEVYFFNNSIREGHMWSLQKYWILVVLTNILKNGIQNIKISKNIDPDRWKKIYPKGLAALQSSLVWLAVIMMLKELTRVK
jgi:hypothetical protein